MGAFFMELTSHQLGKGVAGIRIFCYWETVTSLVRGLGKKYSICRGWKKSIPLTLASLYILGGALVSTK